MGDYQLSYATGRPQMYDKASRQRKAERIIKTLEDFYGKGKLKYLTLLDIGSSTGIIDNVLARSFKKVIGTDIDEDAVKFAKKNFKKKNLEFRIEDAMRLSFKSNTFDVVVCAQVYEHVPNAKKLFSEIHKVLKPGGICYLAAINCLWPWEVHYNLPFLSWLPKPLANIYVKIMGRSDKYYETPKTYWGLKSLARKFKQYEYTQKILGNPRKYGYDDILRPPISYIAWVFSPLAKYFSPTFLWLLEKREE